MTIYTSIAQYNSEEAKRKRRKRARARIRAISNSGGGKPANSDLTFLEYKVDGTDLAAYTFANCNLGAADANRMIIVCGNMRSGSVVTLTSVTVQGIAATIDKEERNTSNALTSSFIAHALVPTGTTGDIVVTWSGVGPVLQGIGTYRVTKYASATPQVTAGAQRTGAGTMDLTLAAAPRGFQVGVGGSYVATNRRISCAHKIGTAPSSIIVDMQSNSVDWTAGLVESSPDAIIEAGGGAVMSSCSAGWKYP